MLPQNHSSSILISFFRFLSNLSSCLHSTSCPAWFRTIPHFLWRKPLHQGTWQTKTSRSARQAQACPPREGVWAGAQGGVTTPPPSAPMVTAARLLQEPRPHPCTLLHTGRPSRFFTPTHPFGVQFHITSWILESAKRSTPHSPA